MLDIYIFEPRSQRSNRKKDPSSAEQKIVQKVLKMGHINQRYKFWQFSDNKFRNLMQYIYIYLTIFHYLFLEFNIWGNMTYPKYLMGGGFKAPQKTSTHSLL